MTLRKKTLLIVTLTIICLLGVIYGISSTILMQGFDELEDEQVIRNLDRASAALENEMENLSTTLRDWAVWDDTYEFVLDLNPDYMKSNLVDGTFITLQVNLIAFFDTSGQQIYAKAFDLQKEEETPLPGGIREHFYPDSILVRHSDIESVRKGLIIMDGMPVMIASRPVLTSAVEGPMRGTMIMAYYLDASKVDSLASLTKLSLEIHDYGNEELPPDFLSASAGLSGKSPVMIKALDSDTVAGYSLLNDVYGNPALILKAALPRSIYAQGMTTNNYLIAALSITGLVFLGLTVLILEKMVLSRLSHVSHSVRAVGESGDISRRIPVNGHDELAYLGTSINAMLESLGKAGQERKAIEQQLQLSDRLAAVGQLAAGVAHEINNPLAAIQGYAQLLTAKTDLPTDASADIQAIYREALRASKITSSLLSFARRQAPERKLVSINDVINEVLKLSAYQMKVKNIEVRTDLAPELPETMADFNQMQQVFLNLIVNAEQAMTGAHGKGTLAIHTESVDGFIRATFADDGPGIEEKNLKRIFDPFFTTKDVGQGTGLGLSICYGIVQEHGGRIYAVSKSDSGATFVVELPVIQGETTA